MTRNEIGVARKKYQEGLELGLKLHQQDQNRSFLYNQSRRAVVDHDDDDGNCGATRNGYNMIISDTHPIYSTVVGDNSSTATTTTKTATTVSSPAAGVVRSLQPFDVSSYYPSSPTNPFFKPSGGMATTAMGFPFTAAQWKELERQAMIYKYMMASLPVPPDLLYSTFSAPSTFSPASYFLGKYGSGITMRWSGNSKDAEPGRCRRTDGKKWRCSRDVAPNQKYCERHMHRGRPRSRKHVELQQQQQQQQLSNFSNNKEKDNNSPPKKTRLSDCSPLNHPSQCVGSSLQPSSKASIFDHPLVSPTNPFEDSRNLAWSDEQQWSQLVETNMNSSVFQQQFEGEPLNLNSHAGYNPKSDELGLLERPLIDAWSMGVAGDKNNGENVNKLSFSSSNGGNSNVIDEEMCRIHMGLGLIDSWVASSATPGGPLAEVLRPNNPAMTDAGEVEFVTPPATAVSSPSGVLQKTLATFSDSSESNSPTTCHNSKADMPFHWMS